jgi:YesN/AraC family two-component response regulator
VSSSRYELKEISLSLTAYWQRAEAAQIHIMEDMRVLFHYLWKITPIADQNPTDITEICFASADYKELEDNLYSEMIRILFCYNKKPADQDILSHKIKEYLDLHLTESIVFSNLDKVFGYNVKYISGVFKNQYLMSPSKYVVNARINLAKKILDENEGIMLKDVARMVGYDDALYFSRVFKAQTGISPSQYIKTTEHSKD